MGAAVSPLEVPRLIAVTHSYLLARDTFDVDNTQPRDPTVSLLGGDRHDNVLQPVHTDVGDLKYRRATVTSEYQHLRRHIEAAIQTKMGLECRAPRMRVASGAGVLCHGVGARAAA